MAALLAADILAGAAIAHARPLRPEVEAFVAEMHRRHDFNPTELRRWFAKAKTRSAVLRAVSAPATALPWYEFRDRFVNEQRITRGVRFWHAHAGTLARARQTYGIPEEVIVATIGVETHYGRHTGSFRVLDSLATLAFDYPPRGAYFRGELEEFLLLVREQGLDPLRPTGSYAGAMGISQFMPSSYRQYAVDFDGDGKLDLWRSTADAIGSVANYYHAFGWRPGEPIVIPASTAGADLAGVVTGGIEPSVTIGELRRHGVEPLTPVADAWAAALFAVETEEGDQAYLGLRNFYVITRYNRSINYALVVHELAQQLRDHAEDAAPALRR